MQISAEWLHHRLLQVALPQAVLLQVLLQVHQAAHLVVLLQVLPQAVLPQVVLHPAHLRALPHQAAEHFAQAVRLLVTQAAQYVQTA